MEDALLAFCSQRPRPKPNGGLLVKTWQFEADQGMNQLSLHLGNLPEGLYHVYLSANGLRSIEKLVVLRP